MIGAGLTLEQAPPLAAPLRFFLTAPLFLIAAGLLAALAPDWTGAPLHPITLALTHLLSLGTLGMVMFGAMTQMLPVVAGAPLPRVRAVAAISHAGLLLGTPALTWGLGAGDPAYLQLGMASLGVGGGAFLAGAGIALVRARALPTLLAMRIALAALAVTLGLGIFLVAWLSGLGETGNPLGRLTRHAEIGLGVWIGGLIIGSAWQVVPMLQITPAYPAAHTRWLPWLLLASLALLLLPSPAQHVGLILLAGVLALFALATLILFQRRKRKVPDVTLDFWRLGLGSLLLCLPVALWGGAPLVAGVLFLLGFALSVVNGMLYKIVPFLAWFHLQAQKGLMTPGLPAMKAYLPDATARRQFRLHLAALLCLSAAPLLPWLALPGGLLLAASGLLLGLNLWGAVRLFQRHEGRFS
jgi:hypothetical protein